MPYMAYKACQNTIHFRAKYIIVYNYHATGNELYNYNKAGWISIQKSAYLVIYYSNQNKAQRLIEYSWATTGSSLKVFRGEVGDVIPRVPIKALLQSALVQVVT